MDKSVISCLEYPDNWCYTCGTKMVKSTWYGYYDTKTGNRYFGPEYKCPNKTWWNIFHYQYPIDEGVY